MNSLTKNFNKILRNSRIDIKCMSTQRNVQEVRIPLTVGQVAGKWWGPTDKRPIVALHGWQDNCGSFDRLIPLLPENIPILALDCPGHGFSYKHTPGMPYHNSDMPILIKQIIAYFGWKRITLMGHSLGAILSYIYGYLFPKEVDFLICIDGLHPLVNPRKTNRVIQSIEEFLKYDALQFSNEEPPSYTLDEMVQRIHLGTRKSIAMETAKYILARNIAPSKKSPGKYYFNRDARLKVGPLEVPDGDEVVKSAANITFPIFISKANESPFFGNKEMFEHSFKILQTSSSDCQFHQIPGMHHVHLNEPEILGGLIRAFIEKHDNVDRVSNFKSEILHSEQIDNLNATAVQLS